MKPVVHSTVSRPSPSGLVQIVALLGSALALSACGDDGSTTPLPRASRGIVVLDGFIQPGLTLLPDSGSASSRIALGAPEEFDAGTMELRNDTVVASSSRGAGDILFVASLESGTVRRVQMPARSNPARARLLSQAGGQALVGVPLRDSASLALVSLTAAGQATVTRINDLGRCPADVFQFGGDIWVVDANATCDGGYSPLGAMRLIRIPAGGGAREVITLDALRGSGAGVVVHNGIAYISAGGDADFSSFPYQLLAGGAITRVDLTARAVLGTRNMPAGTYGASAKLGEDGRLYVSLYEDLVNYRDRTIAYSLPDLTPVGTRMAGADWLALRSGTGEQVSCGSSVADQLGRVHCIQNRTGSATFLMVFAPDGSLVREVAAGQGGVDLRLR